MDNIGTIDLEALGHFVTRAATAKLNDAPFDVDLELAQTPLPQTATFRAMVNTMAKTYYPTDEALRVAWENSRYMINDLAVAECIEKRRRDVALLEWSIQAEDERDKQLVDAARIVEKIIRKTPRFLQLRENLLYASWYGKYGVQLQWARSLVGGIPRYCVYNWLPVNGDKIVFKLLEGTPYEQDTVGIRIGYKRDAIRQKYADQVGPTEDGLAYFLTQEQRDRFIVHRHMIEDGDYHDPYSAGSIFGVGIRSRIYWTWYLMKETLAWLMEYIERSAFGFEIWYYPAGNEKARNAIKDAAENRIGHSGNIILVPQMEGERGPTYQVQRIEPQMGGADVCVSIVKEFFQHQIKRYILGQTLTTESGSTGLGSNLASIHLETYLQIIKYDAINLEETLSRDLVEKVRKFNFPQIDEGALRFKIATEEIDHKDRLDAMRQAYDMGLPIPANQVFEAAGMTPASEDENVLINPAVQSIQMQQQRFQQEIGGEPQNGGDQNQGLGTSDSGDNGSDVDPQFTGVRGVRKRSGVRRTRKEVADGPNSLVRPQGVTESRRQVEQAY